MIYEVINERILFANSESCYAKYEYVNTDIFSWCLEGVTFSTSVNARPVVKQHLGASRINSHVQLQTHGMFIHLLIMLNWALEV